MTCISLDMEQNLYQELTMLQKYSNNFDIMNRMYMHIVNFSNLFYVTKYKWPSSQTIIDNL